MQITKVDETMAEFHVEHIGVHRDGTYFVVVRCEGEIFARRGIQAILYTGDRLTMTGTYTRTVNSAGEVLH